MNIEISRLWLALLYATVFFGFAVMPPPSHYVVLTEGAYRVTHAVFTFANGGAAIWHFCRWAVAAARGRSR